MHQTLDEILEVCERALGEEKPDTKEYCALQSVVNSIREHLQRAKSSKLASELVVKDEYYYDTGAVSTSLNEEVVQIGNAFVVSAEDKGSRDYRMKRYLEDGVPPLDPRLQYLSNEEALNRLSFACSIALTRDVGHNGSGSPKYTTKTLVNALELAAVVLNSGALPCRLECVPPTFSISSSTTNKLFSKILRSKTSGAASKHGSSSNMVRGEGSASTDELASPLNPLPRKINIRESLVDAVIGCGDIVQSKESNEKLCFIFIASLVAAAVPCMCRESSQLLCTVDIRYHTLELHGMRLLRVIQLLFSIFSFSNISSILIEEVKKALNQVVKAIFKHAELEVRLAEEGGTSHLLHVDQNELDSKNNGNNDDAVPGEDLIQVLKFCSSIAQVAPLTSGDTDAEGNIVSEAIPSSVVGPPAASCETNMMDNNASNKVLAPYRNYIALTTALNFILHIIVNGGSVFRKTGPVISCVRQNVIPAVVRTSLSSDIDIFRLSLNVLLQCCVTYGPQLVNETSTIFRHVYFRVLESKFTSLMHKSMVIEVFQRYIEEPQNLLNLFLNYDCNTRSYSIYEEMIVYLDALSRPLHNHFVFDNYDKDNYFQSIEAFKKAKLSYEVPESLRRKALATLLLVAGSNVQWIDRFKTTGQGKDDRKCEQVEAKPPRRTSASVTLETFAPLNVEDDEDSISVKSTSGFVVINESDIIEQEVRGKDEGCYDKAERDTKLLPKDDTKTENTSTRQNEIFLQAKRYKDAIKAFFILFNEMASPEVAIDYLCSSILVPSTDRESEGLDAKDALLLAIASIKKATNSPNNYTPNTSPEKNNAVAPSRRRFFFSEVVNKEEGDAAAKEAARKVAVFLFENRDYLDRLVLGGYFAKCIRSKASRLLLDEWIKLYNFRNMELDEALRLFLGEFKLLGEAQIVDKTMELFAAHYCRQNPDQFCSAESAFILSYSVCMLNTDAHSPHIKDKMTEEGFIKNNRGIDGGRDLDPVLLSKIYERVTQREIVLRPTKSFRKGLSLDVSESNNTGGVHTGGYSLDGKRLEGSILQSIPILRHLSPIVSAITDKVLLPIDTLGNNLFGVADRKRKEMYQKELRQALRDVIEGLQSTKNLPNSIYVSATSIENALPMWEISVGIICHQLINSLMQLLEDSERQTFSSSGPANRTQSKSKAIETAMRNTADHEFFEILLRGVTNTVNVCCSFGNVKQLELLLEHCFQMTQLQQAIVITAKNPVQAAFQVTIRETISPTRLELLACLLNLFISSGVSFTARAWETGYTAISLLDTLANGLEGMWKRHIKCLSPPGPVLSEFPRGGIDDSSRSAHRCTTPEDLWFGPLEKAPSSIDPDAIERRGFILRTIRSFRISSVDLWLERLFDITQFPPMTQLQMAIGLVRVCKSELQHARTFSLSKLFDFVTVCASSTTRLQWRELWSNASEVFVLAGRMHMNIANLSLDGLRIIALTYLMREELLNYSFQKEVLMPFEDILMNNHDPVIRKRVITILSELIDLLAKHLASGWNVVFSCLSRTAVIPEVTESAWEVCENIISRHLSFVKDCFNDLIFCLTTFSCVSNTNEKIPLRAVSYLVACGHWLQYGLESPPIGFCEAEDVLRWAFRFPNTDGEAELPQNPAKHLVRVSLSPEPLSTTNLLEKPTSCTGKSNYHLWMSLFEGLIPIVVMHDLVRVRCHAISSIWMLIKHYAVFFSEEVQESLFRVMLRPILSTLIAHETKPCKTVLDQADYRMLVYLSLHKMLHACSGHRYLLKLSCDTLLELMKNVSWKRVELLESNLADIFVRVCCDFLAAVCLPKLSEGLMPSVSLLLNNPIVAFSDSGAHLGITSRATLVTHAQDYVESSDSCRLTSPFILGLLHKLQKIGTVDILQGKRTAAWAELHVPSAATSSGILLSPSMQTDACFELVREMSLSCLYQGLILPLRKAEKGYCAHDEANCFLLAQAVRHAMLGMSFYCIVTKDMNGVRKLLDIVELRSPETDGVLPLAHLLDIPYLFLLMEFIFAYHTNTPEGQHFLRSQYVFLTNQLSQARQYCLEQGTSLQEKFKQDVPESNLELKTYIGSNFSDLFRSGSMFIPTRQTYYRTDVGLETRKRIYYEWKYLCCVFAIRCMLTLPYTSVLATHISSPCLLELVAKLPSSIEENTMVDFLQNAWKELDLHCDIPEGTTLEACTKLLHNRMHEVS
ncbi:unnamed protein product [Phytomonas sp. EM1]|nr:unnamed protein product [Phytomonas sp. EM1]|eukprot:CCW60657.1 unnamed protein product [Phytomonas sp. isolate EM1]